MSKMNCIDCQSPNIVTGTRACKDCLDISNRNVIDAITDNMSALHRVITLNTQAGTMTAAQLHKLHRQYHKMSIERDILLGNKQKPVKKQSFRNGLYV